MNRSVVLVAALLLASAGVVRAAEPPVGLPGWKLLWHDEFDGPQLDAQKWSLCDRGKSDWNDTMSKDPRCFVLRNGHLQLRGFVNDQPGQDPSPYLTGGVTSKDKFDFCHGKVAIRARFKCAKGAWPALWMLGSQGGWPGNGEIDLMEHLNFDSKVYLTVHSLFTRDANGSKSPPHGSTAPIERDAFNTYGLEWDDARLVFMVNEKPCFTYPRVPEEGPTQWPFEQPFYLIFSMQIGGKWVGEPAPADYPAFMEIDWVRVYQRG